MKHTESIREGLASVSVVMVSYQTGPILFKSIASALEQDAIRQIIVVDNGNSASVIKALQKEFGSDKRLVLVTGHDNIGFARGCNLGVEKAEGDMLLLLNPDCIIPENGINDLLKIAATKKGNWVLAPRLVNPDRTEQQGGRREILTPWMAFVEGFRLYKIAPNHPYFKRFNLHDHTRLSEVTEVPVISGACLMIKKSAYQSIGGMDEGYFLHVEDIDFCLRFRKTGGQIYFCPQTSFVHALGTSEVDRTFVEWHKANGFKRYFKMHFSGIYPPGFIGFVTGSVFVRFALIALKELFSSMLRRVGLKKKLQKCPEVLDPVSLVAKKKSDEKALENTPELHEQQPSQISNPDSYA
jgi:N-acetylglucosaminyl-diphospho-decaprenol L-rhamnosyltransferase